MKKQDPLIQLVRCPLDNSYFNADQWLMPVELIKLAESVDKRCRVEILDGTLLGFQGVQEKLDPSASIIGLSFTALSAQSLDKLVKQAKSNGSTVIAGGQAARGAAKALLTYSEIDGICTRDGEPLLSMASVQLAESELNLASLPNLLIREADSFSQTFCVETDVWNETINYNEIGGLNPEEYFVNYPHENTLVNMGGSKAAGIYSKRGCTRKCSFCARQDKQVRPRNPEIVANEIKLLRKKYGIDYVLDLCDTWIFKEWASEFAKACENYGVQHIGKMIFADVRDIDNNSCRDMRNSGVDSVLLGVESGSERILLRNGKRMSRKQIISAVDRLVSFGIKVSASFVVGLLDEDDNSLEETINLASILHERPGVLCYGNVIIPLMGSWLWKTAFNHISKENSPIFLSNPFMYDLESIRHFYVKHATCISGGVASLENACEEILQTSSLLKKEYAR